MRGEWKWECRVDGKPVKAREFWISLERDIIRPKGEVKGNILEEDPDLLELGRRFWVLFKCSPQNDSLMTLEKAIRGIEEMSPLGRHTINLKRLP